MPTPIHPDGKLRKGFYPLSSLEGKHNYKSNMRIERNGKVTEAVFLWVPDPRLREQIVYWHFLQSYVRWIIHDDVGFKILSRDKPWDFEVATSLGGRFNIEIVTIAESRNLYENNKREETLISVNHRKTIPLSYLRKITRNFPDPQTDELIRGYELSGMGKHAEVENPWFRRDTKILMSVVPTVVKKLEELIMEAIISKATKSNPAKEKTILIIDNRTSAFDLDDYHASLAYIDKFKEASPFQEVWFYTGYYSDNDGSNAEWSVAPIVLPDATWKIFESKLESDGLTPNDDGMAFTKS